MSAIQKESPLKILSLNINSLRSFSNRAGQSLEKWMYHHNADIFCFQETRISDISQAIPIAGYTGYFSICNTKKGYSGVATYIRDGIPCIDVHENFNSKTEPNEGRVLCTDHKTFILFNVYVNNPGLSGEKVDNTISFYKQLEENCSQLKDRHIIVIGDINIAHRNIDTYNPNSTTAFYPRCRKQLSELMFNRMLIDTYRYLHPNDQQFTCFCGRGFSNKSKQGWRIDYALMSSNSIHRLVSSSIISSCTASDHVPVVLTIKNESTQLHVED
jgi:exodeoxyribonuclease-3